MIARPDRSDPMRGRLRLALAALFATAATGCATATTATTAPSGATARTVEAAPSSPTAAPAAARARNVILFVSDGASEGTWAMASHWEHGATGRQVYDSWPVKLGMTTFPLNASRAPTRGAAPALSYDPIQAWSTEPSDAVIAERPTHFAGYRYLRTAPTDSAAAGTAFATGVKTFNNAISVDDFGRPLPLITDVARARGMATGVVSSVPFSHATPAVFGANNVARNAYAEIARDMIRGDRLDVIIGAGDPEFDGDARPRDAKHDFVGAEEWAALKAGTAGRALVRDPADFEAMARGERLPEGRMIGVPRVGGTLQFGRTVAVRGADPARPSGVAFNPGVPDLPLLTRAALEALGRDPDGFFLMVEGGAVDWAAHANDTGRVIEEQMDFNAAVRAASAWLERTGRLSDTLMIVVTDHGNGMPMGPESDAIAFQPVPNPGRGVLPRVRWHTGSHTNENTRLWAAGPGAEGFLSRIRLRDAEFARRTGHNADGATVDNVDVFHVMKAAIEGR